MNTYSRHAMFVAVFSVVFTQGVQAGLFGGDWKFAHNDQPYVIQNAPETQVKQPQAEVWTVQERRFKMVVAGAAAVAIGAAVRFAKPYHSKAIRSINHVKPK